MKKFNLFIFASALAFNAHSMTQTFLDMNPNRPYMNFALSKYLHWHEKNFPSNLPQMQKLTGGFVQQAINQVDHWLVPGHKEFNQFQIGFAPKERYTNQTFRIFIHPSLRSHAFIQKSDLPQGFDPWFIQWDDQSTICWLGPEKGTTELTLKYLCKKKSEKKYTARGQDVLSRKLTQNWPNPFTNLAEWELRTEENGKIKSIYYYSSGMHPSRIPRYLDRVISLHGLEPSFLLDKYSIDVEGAFTVYYP